MELEFTITKTNEFFCFLLQRTEYYHFFRIGLASVIEDKKIDSAGFALSIIRYGAWGGSTESLKMINKTALHVDDFDVDFSGEVL